MEDVFKNTILSIVERTADESLLNNNANKASERIPVMKNMIAGEVAKNVAKDLIPKHILEAHNKGEIHFHDMDESPLLPFFNCSLVNIEKMLKEGFTMGNAEIETPKSIQTAVAVTSQVIAQVACHQYGGVSIDRLDEVLAPYVDKSYYKHLTEGKKWMEHDKAVCYAKEMTEKEVKNSIQSLEYEVNTLFTSQGQSPFVTFGFGLGVSWQSRLIQKYLLETRLKGLGSKGRTAIFPKLVYMIEDGINHKKGDTNYDIKKLAISCASKRSYPDILNMEMLRKNGGGCTSMGCRSFLHEWVNPETNLPEWSGRNNLGVVSLNLPQIALMSETIEDFFNLLDERAKLAREALMLRVNRLKEVKAEVAPILYCSGALGKKLKPDDKVFQLFDKGRASISLGYIGIHEVCNKLLGDTPIQKSKEKQDLALQIVKTLKDYTDSWKQDTGLAFSVYSTPSENLCDRFCRIDKEKFGEVKGVTDKDFYMNSFHLDVEQKVSPMVKIDYEKDFHKFAKGGNITFVEVPNIDNTNREIFIETLWDYTYDKLPYFGTNCVIDYCYECNSDIDAEATEKGFMCPHCENTNPETLEVTKRVCGYLGSPNARPFVKGKQQEVVKRVKHE